MELYPLLKSLHIIFIVTWFAGLFYISRIFIHQTEANGKPEPDRSVLIAHTKRTGRLLWRGITWPSAIITLILGPSMIPYWLDPMPVWLHVKLAFVVGLYIYHYMTHRFFLKLQNDEYPMSSTGLRMWNEIPTVFLFAVVFLVVFKNTISFLYGILGLIVLILAILGGIKVYKGMRKKRPS